MNQNLLERLENATFLFLRTVWVKSCCLWFNYSNISEIENGMSLWWNFIKALNWQYGSNRIVPDAIYLRNLGKLKNIGA